MFVLKQCCGAQIIMASQTNTEVPDGWRLSYLSKSHSASPRFSNALRGRHTRLNYEDAHLRYENAARRCATFQIRVFPSVGNFLVCNATP